MIKFRANLDRRWLFVMTAAAILLPILRPLNLPGAKPERAVALVYETMENLPEGSPVLLALDFNPPTKPELEPMAVAILRHAFKKNHKIIAMNLSVTGTGMAGRLLSQIAAESGKLYGIDYVFLGWQPEPAAVITGLGTDLYKVYPTDAVGNPTRNMPVLRGLRSLKDFAYLINITAGYPGSPSWIAYGSDKSGVKMAAGCTAVLGPKLRPFLASGQLNGLITGIRGAAEYESLIGRPDKAAAGLDAINLAHMLLLVVILIPNIFARKTP